MATPDPVHVHTKTHRERCDAVFHAAFAYSRDVANLLTAAGYDVTDYWFHRESEDDDGPFEGAIVIGDEDEVYSWHATHGWQYRAGPPGQWGPYKTVRDLGLGAGTPAEDVVAAIVEGKAPAAPEPRVCVVVSAPGGADPEDTAQAIARAVQKVAPGADVYTTTSKEDQ